MTDLIALNKIFPNPDQPRKTFDELDLEVLAESIRKIGVLNAVAVEGPHPNPLPSGQGGQMYILLDGERRVRAARMAGLSEIAASVRPPTRSSGERLMLALVGNLQRAEMNPIETAKAFQKLREQGMKPPEIAQIAGMHESSIYNYLNLLRLDDEIQGLFAERRLPLGADVVAALISLPDERRVPVAKKLAEKRSTIQTVLAVCKRVVNSAERHAQDITLSAQSGAPVIQMAERKQRKTAAGDNGKFSMLRLVKGNETAQTAVTWPAIRQAAEETCRECPLYDSASVRTCQDCAAVEILRRLAR
jgi:ParB/RepB/Spo0J family partition protein